MKLIALAATMIGLFALGACQQTSPAPAPAPMPDPSTTYVPAK